MQMLGLDGLSTALNQSTLADVFEFPYIPGEIVIFEHLYRGLAYGRFFYTHLAGKQAEEVRGQEGRVLDSLAQRWR